MGKYPRKLKKKLLGKNINRRKLASLLKSVQVIENKYPDSSTILPYEFCPKCGCREYEFSGNMAEYPERYEKGYCLRCGNTVIESDNSPYIHALECENYIL